MQSYKQIVVETITRGSNAAVAVGGVFPGPGMQHASVGLITGRGTSQVRAGSGEGVTWAEGITGKEYYLSMNPSQTGRNRKLAAAAVRDLGGQATFGGDVRAGSFAPPVIPPQAPQFAPQWGGQGGGQAGATVTLNADVTTTGDPAKVVNDTMFQLRAMYL
jgi:hypothetical protein